MARISLLPAAGPLTGAETLPMVQDGATVRGQAGPLVAALAAPHVATAGASAATAVAAAAAAEVAAESADFLAALDLSIEDLPDTFAAWVSPRGQMAMRLRKSDGAVELARLEDQAGNDVFGQLVQARKDLGEAQRLLRILGAAESHARLRGSIFNSIGRQVWGADPIAATNFTLNNMSTIAGGVLVSRRDPRIRYLGGKPTLQTGIPGYNFVAVESVAATGGARGAGYTSAEEVVYDGRKIGFHLYDAGHNGGLAVRVDGKWSKNPALSYPGFTTDTGQLGYFELDFGVAAKRRIRLESGGGRLGGLVIEPDYQLYDPAPTIPCNMLVLGDSITEPTVYASMAGARMGYPSQLGDLLGIDNLIPSGVGQTGYVQPGDGGRVNLAGRIALDLEAVAAGETVDAILFTMGLNDPAANAAFDTNVRACFNAARTRWPKAVLMATGPLHSYYNAAQIDKAAMIEAACGDVAQMHYIDASAFVPVDYVASRPTWFTEPDFTHPNEIGHLEAYAKPLATAIRTLVGGF